MQLSEETGWQASAPVPPAPSGRAHRVPVTAWAPWAAGVLALTLLPLVTTDDEVLRYADLFLILAIAVMGLTLQQGLAGIINLGPGTNVGVGAYAAATVAAHTHLAMPLPLLAAPAVTAVWALLIGGAAVRLSRLHFAMVSLYGALLIPVIAEQGGTFTGGPDGLANLDPLAVAGHRPDGALLYGILAGLLLVAVATTARVARGPWGRAFAVIRLDDAAASSVGISPAATRLLAVVIASLYGAVAGALLAHAWPGDCPSGFVGATCVVTPGFYGLDLSILLVAAAVIGGPGSRAGAVVAVALLVLVRWAFDTHPWVGGDWQTVIYGALLILTVVTLPRGIGAAAGVLRGRPEPVHGTTRGATAVPPPPPPRRRPGAILEVRRLRVAFDGPVVLDGVDLVAAPGAVHALVGANGSGKTTLVNCVAGLVTPLSGEVRVGGRALRPVRPRRAHRRARHGIARTFQAPRVQPDLTVLDNVMQGLFMDSRRVRRRRPFARAAAAEAALRHRAMTMLEAVGLAGQAGMAAERLTHGERRLLEIARAFVGDPLVVLLDEPAAGLDADERRRLLTVLDAVKAEGPAIVLVEHDLALAHAVADVVTVLDRGRVTVTGTAASVEADAHGPAASPEPGG